jgi:hypothetical protein
MYNRYGPTARICFEFPKEKTALNMHRHRFESALSNLSPRVLQGMVNGLFDIEKADISHTILLLKRVPGDDWSLSTVEIITPAAEMAVRNQLRRETEAEQFKLYRSLASVGVSRGLAGVVYELMAQEKLRLQSPITPDLVPMVQRTSDESGQGKKLSRWHSNHGDGADPSPVLSINILRTDNDAYDTVIHVSMDQSNLDFLGKLFVAENETFLVGSILAILINYVVRNFKHYRTLLKGAMKAISANCCYQWELGQWTSHIG